jgi:hypothetical protein
MLGGPQSAPCIEGWPTAQGPAIGAPPVPPPAPSPPCPPEDPAPCPTLLDGPALASPPSPPPPAPALWL